MLDILQDYLTYSGYTYERLDGSARAEERSLAIKNFRKENTFIFLVSTRDGEVGLNLVEADTEIFYNSDFNKQNDLQAESRAQRIGQTSHSVYKQQGHETQASFNSIQGTIFSEAEELHRVLQPFLLCRFKDEVEKDLPKKLEVVVYHRMSSLQKKYYKAIRNKDRYPWLVSHSGAPTPKACRHHTCACFDPGPGGLAYHFYVEDGAPYQVRCFTCKQLGLEVNISSYRWMHHELAREPQRTWMAYPPLAPRDDWISLQEDSCPLSLLLTHTDIMLE
ncbi:hypothetical protein Q7C36_006195 [Tachysurus vachellii]|uniref:Helicase C-terminal domain-containing protein n=1 Tax=Tachysurus vachellii TaxID=175792 RepID=A0AA88NGC3_TACVA|nr:hypothetical protein Q7C36_006195 [Tachysurus vachellii]